MRAMAERKGNFAGGNARLLALGAIFLVFLLAPGVANAFGVTVCNRGDTKLYVAVVGQTGMGAWYSQGWYPLDRGECFNRGSVWEYQFYLGFFYRDAKGNFGVAPVAPNQGPFSTRKIQSSNYRFCVHPKAGFNLSGSLRALQKCSDGHVPALFAAYVTGQRRDSVRLNVPIRKSTLVRPLIGRSKEKAGASPKEPSTPYAVGRLPDGRKVTKATENAAWTFEDGATLREGHEAVVITRKEELRLAVDPVVLKEISKELAAAFDNRSCTTKGGGVTTYTAKRAAAVVDQSGILKLRGGLKTEMENLNFDKGWAAYIQVSDIDVGRISVRRASGGNCLEARLSCKPAKRASNQSARCVPSLNGAQRSIKLLVSLHYDTDRLRRLFARLDRAFIPVSANHASGRLPDGRRVFKAKKDSAWTLEDGTTLPERSESAVITGKEELKLAVDPLVLGEIEEELAAAFDNYSCNIGPGGETHFSSLEHGAAVIDRSGILKLNTRIKTEIGDFSSEGDRAVHFQVSDIDAANISVEQVPETRCRFARLPCEVDEGAAPENANCAIDHIATRIDGGQQEDTVKQGEHRVETPVNPAIDVKALQVLFARLDQAFVPVSADPAEVASRRMARLNAQAEKLKTNRKTRTAGHDAEAALAHLREGGKAFRDGDHAKARTHFKKAAEAGNAVAQYLLSKMLWAGQGGKPSVFHSIRWLKRASDNGHKAAREEFAGLKAAAEKGDDVSVRLLKELAEYERLEARLAKARDRQAKLEGWARRLEDIESTGAVAIEVMAVVANRMAQNYALATRLYEQGKHENAVATWKKLAQQGHANSQLRLSRLYRETRNHAKAFKWAYIVAHSHPFPEKRRQAMNAAIGIKNELTSEQFRSAQSDAESWLAKQGR